MKITAQIMKGGLMKTTARSSVQVRPAQTMNQINEGPHENNNAFSTGSSKCGTMGDTEKWLTPWTQALMSSIKGDMRGEFTRD